MKWILFVLIALGVPAFAQQQTDEKIIEQHLLNSPSAAAWTIYGMPMPTLRTDNSVKGGHALRVTVPRKGDNPWDIAALAMIDKEIRKGDAVLVAFWARANVPAEGYSDAILAGINVQQSLAPYHGVFGESAQVSGKWAMYYASGLADQNYAAGTVQVSVQLAAAKQEIDLGPVFVLDLGPNYDVAKLPHNKPTTGTLETDPLQLAEEKFARELALVRTGLPKNGKLIADPSNLLSAFGEDQFARAVPAPDLSSAVALRFTMPKAAAHDWDDAAAIPIAGAIKKGDVVQLAIFARTAGSTAGQTGKVCGMGVNLAQSPWTPIMMDPASIESGNWRIIRATGVAEADMAPGNASATVRMGCAKQVVEFGPAFVLDFGPDIDVAKVRGQ